jgi:HEPN domain-containing protein
MARKVRKESAKEFLKKSEEFYYSALENYQKSRYDVSVFDSSQAIILANDAFCIFKLGRRASKDHREAIRLHVQASEGKKSKREIVAEALEKRSEFGYTEKKSSQKSANLLLIRTKRFIDWVKGNID